MNILITNIQLNTRTGTELYVRDLALELQRLGHTPAVYSWSRGPIAAELKAAHIPVVEHLRDLRKSGFQPQLIHGHGYCPTLEAVVHFSSVPALYVCHNHSYWKDAPPFHVQILEYLAVSDLCLRRLLIEGVPPAHAHLSLNWVDVRRFRPRPPLPAKPRRALVFSNYANNDTHLPAVTAACQQAGIPLDVAGAEMGRSIADPENVLGQYDLVFAKAKAAMEAMAVGAAVVLCDFGGVGPLVTSRNMASLLPLNFGFQALTQPLQAEHVLAQIRRYDAEDAAAVRDTIRATASLETRTSELIDLYGRMIQEWQQRPDHPNGTTWRHHAHIAVHRVFEHIAPVWRHLSDQQRRRLEQAGPLRPVLARIRRFLPR